MVELEKRNKKSTRRSRIQRIILNSVANAGMLGIALIAPNVLKAMYKLGISPKDRQKEYVASSASKLAKKGLMRFENGYYQLTKEGERLLDLWNISGYKFKNHKKWDRKWRIVIFDIPEKKRGMRRQITSIFRQAGLYRLQDSVWVYPYDCENIIGLLKTDLGVGKDVLYIIADQIENDKYLRTHFGLDS